MTVRRNKSDQQKPAGAPTWMVTYGDLVTQILIFFVLLFSMSALDVEKFRAALLSLQGALGFLEQPVLVPPEETAIEPPPGIEERDYLQMLDIQDLLQRELANSGLEATVVINLEERGLVIRFADSVLFDLGKADIKPAGRDTLESIGGVLAEIPNHVRVEGHTDDLPIMTAAFPSNWELSTTRATNVLRYLIDAAGIQASRLSAAGYGEYRPVAPNDSPENRQLNRRVDVVLLFLTKTSLEPQ